MARNKLRQGKSLGVVIHLRLAMRSLHLIEAMDRVLTYMYACIQFNVM